MKRLIITVLTIICCTQAAMALDPPRFRGPFGVTSPWTDIEWRTVDGATWYRVWMSADSSPGTAIVDEWVEGDTFVEPPVLSAGDYTVWLQAWGPSGYSAWSRAYSLTVGTLTDITIDGSAFQPRDEAYNFSKQPGRLGISTAWSWWYANLDLPIGTELSSVILYFRNLAVLPDNRGPTLQLIRTSLYTDSQDTLVNINASNQTSPGFKNAADDTLSYPVMASGYSHSFGVYLKSTQTELIGVRVFYWGRP